MKSLKLSLAVVGMAVSAAAAPEISQLSVTQESQTRVVSVSYALNEPAIVTMEFFTNGVPINVHDVRNIDGTLNALVPAGSYTHHWIPYKDVPGGGKVADAQVKVTAWPTNSPPLYMAVDLTHQGGDIHFYPSVEALPYPLADDHWKTDSLLMRRIYAAGKPWRMGSPTTESQRQTSSDETAHLVTLTEDYYMGVYEVTRQQHYRVYGGSDPTTNAKLPQANVSPNDLRGTMTAGADYDWPNKGHAVAPNSIIDKWRAQTNNRIQFDLPTKAQWEFAGRAGTVTRFGVPDEAQASLNQVAWNSANEKWAHEVGTRQPNAWGLYDTLGNLGEWCLDWTGEVSDGSAVVDPVGPTTGTVRSAKGSGFWWGSSEMRYASNIHGWTPDQKRDNHGYRLWAPVVVK